MSKILLTVVYLLLFNGYMVSSGIVSGIATAVTTGQSISSSAQVNIQNTIKNYMCQYELDYEGYYFLNDGSFNNNPFDIPGGQYGGYSAEWDWSWSGVEVMVAYDINSQYQLVIYNKNPTVGYKGFWFDLVPRSSTSLRDRYFKWQCGGRSCYWVFQPTVWTDTDQHEVTRYGIEVEAQLASSITFTVKPTNIDNSKSCGGSSAHGDTAVLDVLHDDITNDYNDNEIVSYKGFRAGVVMTIFLAILCLVIAGIYKCIIKKVWSSNRRKTGYTEAPQTEISDCDDVENLIDHK